MQGVGRNPRSGGDWAQKPAMKGEARIRKNGDAIRSPAHTAAQSIMKIVLFRQDMVPSPFVEGLSPVALVLNIGRYRAQRSDGRHRARALPCDGRHKRSRCSKKRTNTGFWGLPGVGRRPRRVQTWQAQTWQAQTWQAQT